MKRILPLLVLTGLLFGQDVLTHKSGKIYKGKYYGIVEQNIIFYVEGETGNKMFPIWEVTSIELESTKPIVTDFDILNLKSGTTYFGEYSKIEEEIVYFKPKNAFAFQPISIKQIQTLKLKDGHFIIGGELSTKEIVSTYCVIIMVVIILGLGQLINDIPKVLSS